MADRITTIGMMGIPIIVIASAVTTNASNIGEKTPAIAAMIGFSIMYCVASRAFTGKRRNASNTRAASNSMKVDQSLTNGAGALSVVVVPSELSLVSGGGGGDGP